MAKALPHIIAVIIFLAISIFMYRPIIFEGKVMDQNDINQGRGAAKEIVDYREATGEQALWTNSMFSGMPSYLTGLQWSGGAILNVTQRILLLYLPRPVGENFLAFITFYIMLLVFGVRPYLALGGALSFGLSTFFVISIQAGHMWKIRAIAYMPLVIAGVRLVFKKKYIMGFILTAFALALEINANHPQITYYLFLLLLVFGISEFVNAIKNKEFSELVKKTGILLVAATIAVGANFGKLWTTYEYGEYSIRGKSELSATPSESKGGLDREYAFRWSSGKWESLTMFIPHLYGGASGVYNGKNSEVGDLLRRNNMQKNEIAQIERGYLGYWGNQPGTAGPAYAGAVIFFLFILSLLILDNKTKYWMLTVIVLSIILSWGKNFPAFNNLMFDLFPGYNKFRAVTMVIMLALTLIPFMGFLGLEKLLSIGWTKEVQKKLFIAGGASVGLALMALIMTNPPYVEGVQKVFADAIENDRNGIIQSDVYRSIFYVVLTFGAVFFYLKNKISEKILGIIIIALVLLDLGLVDSRYLNDSVFRKKSNNAFINITPADEKILEDEDLSYRVLNLQNPFNEARTSYYHKSIGGYHGAKMRRYQDVISRYIVTEMEQIMQDKGLNKNNSGVISMLNSKYLMAGFQANAVIPNGYANGNAWFINKITEVNSPDEEIEQIGIVDLKNTAVIDQSAFEIPKVKFDSLSTIKLIEYLPNKMVYEASTNAHALAVFSEVFYPKGWEAYINGKEVDIVRANYILRALIVEPGSHKIEFIFKPKSYFIGNKIMMISSILLLILVAFGIFKLWKEGTSKTQ